MATALNYPPCFEIPDPCNCAGYDSNIPGDVVLMDAAKREAAINFAIASKWKFNACQVTVAPCFEKNNCCKGALYYYSHNYGLPAYPYFDNGVWRNDWCCNLDRCECDVNERIYVPNISSLVNVTIGGIVQDPANYYVRGSYLYSKVGFPSCNSSDPTSLDHWSITVTQGIEPPEPALKVIASYACQIYYRCKGIPCVLDDNYQVIERGGMEMVVIPPNDYRAQGLTGYKPVDDWIMLDAQGRARLKPQMFRRKRCEPFIF